MVEFEREDAVAIITLNRPEARNAINRELEQALYDVLEQIDADDSIRAAVIAANGPVFCSGADLKQVNRNGNPTGEDRLRRDTIVSRAHAKPLIAAVDGPAYGGGFEIVLNCDLVVASTTAKFALSEVRWGLLASGGGMFRLPRKLPENIARQMLYTGAPIGAERLHALGLVNELTGQGDARARAIELATAIAANGPLALRLTSEMMERSALLDEAGCWALSRELVARNFESHDAREGPRAFAEKRAPQWRGE
ncbi:enoyl-CoA hydratase [Sphingobium faniae]|nr:enoyl-CoA hydratase [Sphingobium faniae]